VEVINLFTAGSGCYLTATLITVYDAWSPTIGTSILHCTGSSVKS
jgi:hypothetical protein